MAGLTPLWAYFEGADENSSRKQGTSENKCNFHKNKAICKEN